MAKILNKKTKRLKKVELLNRVLIEKIRKRSTKLKQRTKELEQALKSQKQFIASISHELRTPLHAIIGFLSLLDDEMTDERHRAMVRKALLSSRHLTTLLNDLLDASKIDAGQLELHPTSFSLCSLIDEVSAIALSRLREGVIYEPVILCDDISIIADEQRLSQILLNLLSNAFKFTSEGRVVLTVALKCSSDGSLLLDITVADSGIGIPQDEQEKIFEPFYRVHNAESSSKPGTGLGLYIVRNLTKLMGGTISLQSSRGKGSTFHLQIPIQPATNTYQSSPLVEGKCLFLGPIHLLLVEDVLFNIDLMKELLATKFGIHNITVAQNGQEALDLVKIKSFDLIFMDIVMPIMDGFEAISALRAAGCRVPIIAMSANALREDIDKALRCGANDYITKPFQYDELWRILSTYGQPS
ncbi:MAG: response regulator [Campylobacterales bacterium]